ncbi:MAG: cation:proton antiporter [Alphaproteobacteria bacterium]|nr:cation:proton antiporter [Alphaproteobacteria bacterium]
MEDFLGQFSAYEANSLIAFGVLLICGTLGGILANKAVWLPTITAFMMVGFILGPHGLNIFNTTLLSEAEPLVDIALGLILYKLGNTLHPRRLLSSKRMLLTSLAETGITFLAVLLTVMLAGYNLIVAALVASISISSSPAILVHVSEEMKAKGPLTEQTKNLVALNNIISFLFFTAVLPFALSTSKFSWTQVLVLPLYRCVVAAAIGTAIAWLVTNIARILSHDEEHYRFTIVAGSIALTMGISLMLNVSLLFSMLTLGIATKGFEKSHAMLSSQGLSEGADLFFIILFVMAGTHLNVEVFSIAGALPFVLALVRSAAKFLGIFSVKRLLLYTNKMCFISGLLIVPMAGMAIGLVTTLQNLVPELGVKVSSVIFTMVILFETIGPFATVAALRMSGEAGHFDEEPENA